MTKANKKTGLISPSKKEIETVEQRFEAAFENALRMSEKHEDDAQWEAPPQEQEQEQEQEDNELSPEDELFFALLEDLDAPDENQAPQAHSDEKQAAKAEEAVAEKIPRSPALFDKEELEDAWTFRSDQDCQKSFQAADPHKALVSISVQSSQLEALKQKHPNYNEVIAFYQGQIAIAKRTGKPINIPPVNLQGIPGIGKTLFVQDLAHALGLEFFDLHISGMHSEFELVGGNQMWSKATAGSLATTLVLRAETYHPIILLDEICLLSKNERVDMYHPLYGVLDKEQARRFRDHYLDINLDVSNAIYITTTNNIEKLPQAIRSRLTSFTIRPPSYQETLAMVPKIFTAVQAEFDLQEQCSQHIPDAALKQLAHGAPRDIKLKLKAALGLATARAGADAPIELALSDFQDLTELAAPEAAPPELLH